MNSDTTCCETPVTEATHPARGENPTVFAQPVWNARRHENGVDLEVTLPGVRKEDVRIEVQGAHLELEARRTLSSTEGRLVYGSAAPDAYRLRLRLGESLDGTTLGATLADGILKVSVPLAEAAKPKRIEIQ